MSQSMPQIAASHPASTAVMAPNAISAKLAELDLPTFTAEEKADNAQELAFGVDKETAKGLLFNLSEGGVSAPGLNYLAAPTGFVASLFAKDFYSKQELSQMTDEYRNEIAQKLGVEPEAVTEQHLKLCAQQDAGLASALVAVAQRRDTHVGSNLVALGGMGGGTAAGAALGSVILPGIGTLAGGFLGGMLGYEAGETTGNYIQGVSDVNDRHALINAIKQKKHDGTAVSAADVVAIELTKFPDVQENIKAKHGSYFAHLDAETKKEVMHGLPALTQDALRKATMCNFPDADLNMLMFDDAPALNGAANMNVPTTQWTARIDAERGGAVAAQRPQNVGFAEAILKGREAFTDRAQEASL